MIDDYAKAMALMHKMEAQLPIPARPTGACVRALQEQGVETCRDQVLQIRRVFYFGDEGGISCDVTPSRDAEQALVVSITHLRIDPRHPLWSEIRAYQRQRSIGIAQPRTWGRAGRSAVRSRRKRRR